MFGSAPGGRRRNSVMSSFTILLPEGNPLLFYSQRGILYYSTPREESFTSIVMQCNVI